ncbi:hypothetical protein [Pelagicoccus sp. SDUM812002]|uniref:hypothetical protein n=1 Tax=Pelagicoccus sp. SDUM812002 TaxID=3041266 RepID=UPI00280D924B|nr:hypothetical protein [Pelagicoccus sp. SDUM812002]MDQ8188409.1 hypothetical protein [Pelagicoccus sp. SDUM812002]
MKYPLFVAILLIALSASARDETTEPSQPVVIENPTTVFSKAFWRRPHPEDKIVHAERREWLDTSGKVTRWQWFLVIDLCPGTKAWLDTNPFLLTPTDGSESQLLLSEAPEWFDLSDSPESQFQRASLSFSFMAGGNRLYASDSGTGLNAELKR